jgi:hypothetical protein
VPLEFVITLETKEETKSQTTKVTQGFEGLVVAMELQKLGYQCWLKYLSTKGDEAVFQELGPLARDASAKNKRFDELREDLVSLPSALTGAYDLGSKEGQANLVKFMEPVQNATDSAIQFLSFTYHVMKDIGRDNLSGFITDLKEMLPNWDVRPELNTEAALRSMVCACNWHGLRKRDVLKLWGCPAVGPFCQTLVRQLPTLSAETVPNSSSPADPPLHRVLFRFTAGQH